MQRKVMLLAAAGILALATSAVMAGAAEDPAAKGTELKAGKAEKGAKTAKDKPAAQDLTVSGVIGKVEIPGKGGEKKTGFVLKQDDGTAIRLPRTDVVKLDEFVDAKVTVTGKGFKHEKKGATKIVIQKIDAVKKADAAAAEKAVEKAVDKAL